MSKTAPRSLVQDDPEYLVVTLVPQRTFNPLTGRWLDGRFNPDGTVQYIRLAFKFGRTVGDAVKRNLEPESARVATRRRVVITQEEWDAYFSLKM